MTVFIGSGAGFAGDRTDAAVSIVAALSKLDGPRYLIFETLAERTLALAQIEKRRDPARGYSSALTNPLRPILKDCVTHGIKIVSNFVAANPRAAAAQIAAIGLEVGCRPLRIAVVEGDDLTGKFSVEEFARREIAGSLLRGRSEIISASL